MPILDAAGKAITAVLPTAAVWTETLRLAYKANGITPTFRTSEDGKAVVASWNGVETTHELSLTDPVTHVQTAAKAMRHGPIWKNGSMP